MSCQVIGCDVISCVALCHVMQCDVMWCVLMWWASSVVKWCGAMGCHLMSLWWDVAGCDITLWGSKWLCDAFIGRWAGDPYYKVLQVLDITKGTTKYYYTVLLCTTQYYSVLQSTTRYYRLLLQHYKVLQSTIPVLLWTTKYVVQSSTPVLLCTTKHNSSSTLYYKVLVQFYSVLHGTPLFYWAVTLLICYFTGLFAFLNLRNSEVSQLNFLWKRCMCLLLIRMATRHPAQGMQRVERARWHGQTQMLVRRKSRSPAVSGLALQCLGESCRLSGPRQKAASAKQQLCACWTPKHVFFQGPHVWTIDFPGSTCVKSNWKQCHCEGP